MGTTPTGFPKLRGSDATLSRAQDNINIQLGPISQALSQTPIMGTAPVWTPAELTTSFAWVGAPYAKPQFYKDSLWRVWSVGELVSPGGAGANSIIYTLPAGLRPNSTQRKPVRGAAATVQFVVVDARGTVRNEIAVGAGASINVDFSFLAEA